MQIHLESSCIFMASYCAVHCTNRADNPIDQRKCTSTVYNHGSLLTRMDIWKGCGQAVSKCG